MNAETVVNVVANCTTAFSALGILIHIFGDPNNPIWDNTVKAWLAKGGLSIAACGAISNVLTLSTPPITEVILNVGISITFFWLNWWQWEIFKTTYLKTKAQSSRSLSTAKGPVRTQKRKSIPRKKVVSEDRYYQ